MILEELYVFVFFILAKILKICVFFTHVRIFYFPKILQNRQFMPPKNFKCPKIVYLIVKIDNLHIPIKISNIYPNPWS